MWMVIHMAKSQAAANQIKEKLVQEGFLVKTRPVYRAVSDEENYFELLVLRAEAEEAHQILLDNGLC